MPYNLIANKQDCLDLAQYIRGFKIIFADTEGTSLDPYTNKLLLISLCVEHQDGRLETFVVDVRKCGKEAIKTLIYYMMYSRTVWHNATYDIKVIWHHTGLQLFKVYCTMTIEQVLIAGIPGVRADLQSVAQRRLNIFLDKKVRDGFIDDNFDRDITEDEYNYSAEDAAVLVGIYHQQMQEITEQSLEETYDIEINVSPITADMEYFGIAINEEKLRKALPVFQEFVRKADQKIQDFVIQNGLAEVIVFTRDGYTAVNTASPAQMLKLANKIGIEVNSLSKTELTEWDNNWSDNQNKKNKKNNQHLIYEEEDDELKIGYHHPFLRLHAIRTASEKILGTYVQGLLDRINPVTGRIHPNFKQCGAQATGRYSSSNPNFQNMPNLSKLRDLGLGDWDIRSMFVPSNGRKFIIADYSGIEAVILAGMANDENMLEKLKGDIHSYVASELFNTEVIKKLAEDKVEPHSTFRKVAKTINYAIMYGVSGYNLYRRLALELARVGYNMRREDGDKWIARWKQLFPKTGALLDQNAQHAITRHYVTTVTGRRRRWEPRYLNTPGSINAAMREGMNAPIQGSSADLTKLAMYLVYNQIDRNRARLLATIHDELLLEADMDYVDEAARITKWAMEEAGKILFPNIPEGLIKADPKISDCYNK